MLAKISCFAINNSSRLVLKACVPTRSIATVPFQFVEAKSGKVIKVEAELGKSLLDVSIDNNVEVEGACGGEMACSTCHMVLSKALFTHLPEKEEEEEDMLDLAVGIEET